MAGLTEILLLAGIVGGGFAAADSANCDRGQSKKQDLDTCTTFSVLIENDTYFNGGDRYYTQGLQLRWTSPEVVGEDDVVWQAIRNYMVPWGLMADGPRRRVSFGLGQNIYTPANTAERRPIPQDRPYAGWTYLSFGGTAQSKTEGGLGLLDLFELDLGVVGSGSAAKFSQSQFHRMLNIDLPQGWGNQIDNEPGVVAYGQRQWRSPDLFGFGAEKPGPVMADVAPHLGGALGNVFTYGAVGGILRLGYQLPDDFGPPGIRPGLPGSNASVPSGNFSVYAFAGGEARAVARNMFLDGGLIGNDPQVDRKPLVGDLHVGLAVQILTVRLTVAEIMRSPEFHGQNKRHQFGALTASFRF